MAPRRRLKGVGNVGYPLAYTPGGVRLRPFQEAFLRGATAPGIDTAAFSAPRASGKSFLAGRLLARVLTPGDPLHRPGTESVLCSGSMRQARIVYRFVRAELEPRGGYRFMDSANRLRVLHVASGTALEGLASNGKTAFGLVGCPWAICDEPGSWETAGGELMHAAVETAKGKAGSPLTAVYTGTLAPSTSGWWHDLIAAGSHGSTYVQALQGERETWDQWSTIRRCNPLVEVSADFRRRLLEERDAARKDTRLKAQFLSYRLNLPTADESTMLLTVEDWARIVARAVPERDGRPIVAVDLGGGRAWSGTVAMFRSGRVEALAVAPGLPSLADQERRDLVPSGTYRALAGAGSVAPRLGIAMPRVASGTYVSATISTSLTAGAKAAGAAQEATAASFTATSVTPKRISARLGIRVEGVAAVGQANFEAVLRENLALVLSDALDKAALNGDGTAPNLAGIFQRLTDPTAPTKVADFDIFAGAHAAGIDGLWAPTLKDVAIVCGPATMALSARTFQSATNYKGEMSAAAYAAKSTGGWWTNKRMPAVASKIQQALLYRKGRSMMGGAGAMRTAVCPQWGAISIDDIFSGSASGERFFTMHVLLGDVILVQPDAYAQVSYKVVA